MGNARKRRLTNDDARMLLRANGLRATEPRVAVVMALANQAQPLTWHAVLELLDRLVRRNGGTMLVATHSARVAAFCDRVLELSGGRLDERRDGPDVA